MLPAGQELRRDVDAARGEPRRERALHLARPLGHEEPVPSPLPRAPQRNDLLHAAVTHLAAQERRLRELVVISRTVHENDHLLWLDRSLLRWFLHILTSWFVRLSGDDTGVQMKPRQCKNAGRQKGLVPAWSGADAIGPSVRALGLGCSWQTRCRIELSPATSLRGRIAGAQSVALFAR